VRGVQPLREVNDVVLRLTTSQRAVNAITNLLEDGAEEIPLYFLPFNRKMRTEREFRVFCPPGDGRISAVTQYKWHAPSIFASLAEGELESTFQKVFGEIQQVHEEILGLVKKRGDEMDELMLRQGFTFDVLWDGEEERCQLIELNSFGTRSGCGACLFHWLRDGEVLYGKEGGENGEVEFRISI
jgi:hypothetical protein